jgi:inorganic pyrophosphatase
MVDYSKLPLTDGHGHYHAVVESPAGSKVKLKYEPALGVFVFHRALVLGAAYPYEWGFFPSTRGEDGDPLDVMVLTDAPTWPGTVITVRPIGLLLVSQREKGRRGTIRNHRIIAVPATGSRYESVKDLPRRIVRELEEFFTVAVRFTGKKVTFEGWRGARAARRSIDEAARAGADGPTDSTQVA